MTLVPAIKSYKQVHPPVISRWHWSFQFSINRISATHCMCWLHPRPLHHILYHCQARFHPVREIVFLQIRCLSSRFSENYSQALSLPPLTMCALKHSSFLSAWRNHVLTFNEAKVSATYRWHRSFRRVSWRPKVPKFRSISSPSLMVP